MKRHYYPNSAAGRPPPARTSLAVIPFLAWIVAGLTWLGPGQNLVAQPTYTRITEGIMVTDTNGGWSANWVDYDDDGYLDMTVAQGDRWAPIALYHNEGDGTFTKVTNNVIAQTYVFSHMHAWGDYDNDGRLDLFMPVVMAGNDVLFHNEGNGSFTKITNDHPTIDGAGSGAAVWGDYDRDGFVDLYVTTTAGCPPSQADLLYRNNGDGTFHKTTSAEVGPIVSDLAQNDAAVWVDLDNDGWPELWRNRARGCDWWMNVTNEVWRRNDDGKFSLVDIGEMARGAEQYTWVSWGDYDNDGLLDGAVASQAIGTMGLYRNLGGLQFTNVAASAFAGPIRNAYPYGGGDYDNDGWLDLAVFSETAPTALYRNNGNGTFTLTNVSGLTFARVGCAPYLGDYNNDGFLDIFLLNGLNVPNSLFRHNGNGNHWLKVKLDGRMSNRCGIGAKVRVHANIAGRHLWQMREISSQGISLDNGLIAHFGLGDAANVETLRIEWPSGEVTELRNVPVNQFLTLPETGVALSPRTVLTAPGSNVTLRALVSGIASPLFQWKLNGTNLPGATSDTLVLNNIQVADAGTYTVEVSDGTQTYRSNPCVVTVYDKPVITQQPQSASVVEGRNTNFTVSAFSVTPIRYQWRFKSATLTDRTNATLTVTNVQAENEGLYDVVVSDDFGSVVSDPAQLTVLLKPRITLCATNYTVVQGGNLTLSVEVRSDGALPMTYRWRRKTTTLIKETLDAHQSFLLLANVQPAIGGPDNPYTIILTNAASMTPGVLSSNIYLTVLPDTDGDGMDDYWETNYPTCTEPDGDADSDGLTNLEEYLAGTDCTDPESYLKVERIAVSGEAMIEFIAATNLTYTVEYSENLDAPLWHTLADVVAGPGRTVVVTDPAGSTQRIYRLVTPRMPDTN